MPYIDENHLVNLHKVIESKEISEEKLLNELRRQREEKDRIHRSRNVFRWTSVSLIAVLFVGVLLYFVKPSVYVNDSLLQSQNKMLIDKNDLQSYKDQISQLEGHIENSNHQLDEIDYRNIDKEVIYAVQIAALENKDLSLYSEELRNISQYRDQPYNKYSLGNFTSLDDAKTFRKELVDLGFNDAFVASYKDGKRIKIEEAF
ncbi:SPOR domain-containing protein [Galbibacter sp. EGI 63066]|uniref:SPOR domain-containing protein n=1 Tax=Galbibacter sp. EGI 63066 TaxID=2993559 RepID=UPI00224972CE|nr:SPOR domain-containing protein [Galbibacter sp. EGI 63066]MCX2680122.1 SPOR domain-containing protein [Galbibacter sp. EGI 63066]